MAVRSFEELGQLQAKLATYLIPSEELKIWDGLLPNQLLPLDVLNSADGYVKRLLISYLDIDEEGGITADNVNNSELEKASKEVLLAQKLIVNLHDTIKQVSGCIEMRLEQSRAIVKRASNSGLTDNLKAECKLIKEDVEQLQCLERLLRNFEEVLTADLKAYEENLHSCFRGILGARLKLARQNAVLSQDDFAKKIGLTRISITRYEVGSFEPSAFLLYRMAKILGVSVDWLLCLKEEP